MKYFAALYLLIGVITCAHSIRNTDCGALDREACRGFAISTSYFMVFLWPMYWTFESRPA